MRSMFSDLPTKRRRYFLFACLPPPTAIERAIAKQDCDVDGELGARGERGKGRMEGVAVTDSFVFGSTVSICDGRGEREEGRGGGRGSFAPHSHSEDRIGERSGLREFLKYQTT